MLEYNVINSAQTFSEVASFLAGFTLTAIILIIQCQQGNENDKASALSEKALSFLCFTLFANIVGAVWWGVVAGMNNAKSSQPFLLTFFASLVTGLATAMTMQSIGFFMATIKISSRLLKLTRGIFFLAVVLVAMYIENMATILLLVEMQIDFASLITNKTWEIVAQLLALLLPISVSVILYSRKTKISTRLSGMGSFTTFLITCIVSLLILTVVFSLCFFLGTDQYLSPVFISLAIFWYALLSSWAIQFFPRTVDLVQQSVVTDVDEKTKNKCKC